MERGSAQHHQRPRRHRRPPNGNPEPTSRPNDPTHAPEYPGCENKWGRTSTPPPPNTRGLGMSPTKVADGDPEKYPGKISDGSRASHGSRGNGFGEGKEFSATSHGSRDLIFGEGKSATLHGDGDVSFGFGEKSEFLGAFVKVIVRRESLASSTPPSRRKLKPRWPSSCRKTSRKPNPKVL